MYLAGMRPMEVTVKADPTDRTSLPKWRHHDDGHHLFDKKGSERTTEKRARKRKFVSRLAASAPAESLPFLAEAAQRP